MKNGHKWMQYKYLRQYKDIRGHLPDTRRLTSHDFNELIEKYGDVIVKPNHGSRGRGVYRISVVRKKKYTIHTENMQNTIEGKARAYQFIKGKIGYRKYLVQRRIQLATVYGRPMDVRVIVQRKRGSETWKVTGKAVKVAGDGYIVTNITRSKGTVLPVKTALRKSSLKGHSASRLLLKVDRLAIRAAERLSGLYPHHRIFGFDMGLDRTGRAWIIDINRLTMLSHFRMLKDKTMYRRILKYKKR